MHTNYTITCIVILYSQRVPTRLVVAQQCLQEPVSFQQSKVGVAYAHWIAQSQAVQPPLPVVAKIRLSCSRISSRALCDTVLAREGCMQSDTLRAEEQASSTDETRQVSKRRKRASVPDRVSTRPHCTCGSYLQVVGCISVRKACPYKVHHCKPDAI